MLVTFLRRFFLVFRSLCKSRYPYGSSNLHFLFSRVSIRIFLATVSSFSKTASKPARPNCIVYVSRTCTIPSYHSGGISVSRVCYVFCIFFLRFPSFITIVFIFYLVVIFPSQTRIRVNIKVVRCLKYSASLVSTQSVLRRNSDNMSSLGINTSINIRRTLIIMLYVAAVLTSLSLCFCLRRY